VRVGVRLGTVRVDHATVREELAGVIEHDDAVAEQVPALFRVTGDGKRGVAVGSVR
jgi:hypothetical protein